MDLAGANRINWQIGRQAVDFVLVETSHPGNIGAAARAIAVMGFDRLTVVSPRFADATAHPDARAFASGAESVLANAKIVASLPEALANTRLAIAISASGREFAAEPQRPEQVGQTVREWVEHSLLVPNDASASADQRSATQIGDGGIALVFGTERTGLSIAQAQQCQHLCSIDADPQYSSLNLAQAVQVLAYCVRQALTGVGQSSAEGQAEVRAKTPGDEWAPLEQVEGLFGHLERALIKIEFLDPARPKRLLPRLRRQFARGRLTVKEVDIWRGICAHILKKRGDS